MSRRLLSSRRLEQAALMYHTLNLPFGSDLFYPEKDFFLPPHAQNLRHATLRKTTPFGEVGLLIVSSRMRDGKEHFGLAGFGLC